MAGRKFQIGHVSLFIVKRIILICVCGRHKIGWKETKSWSDVESTTQRSRFGRTNIFLGSCILGMYSKTVWNKQRYCGQLQNHVRIANFRGRNRKTSIPRESSYFFVIVWYGRSCQEMCGAILCGKEMEEARNDSSVVFEKWRARKMSFWMLVLWLGRTLSKVRWEILWTDAQKRQSNCTKFQTLA